MQEGYIENREPVKPEGYFSVSHLLNKVYVTFADGHTEAFHILEGKNKNGLMKFQAFGGGAKLTQDGLNYLKQTYGDDIRFRDGEEIDDARFYLKIPSQSKNDVDNFERSVLEPFASFDSGLIETTIERELETELPEAAPGFAYNPRTMQITYAGAVSPKKWEERGSQRSDGSVLYGRIFHLFDLHMPEEQFNILRMSPNVRVLSSGDNQDILGATRKGKALTPLSDGSIVAENIFPDFDTEHFKKN